MLVNYWYTMETMRQRMQGPVGQNLSEVPTAHFATHSLCSPKSVDMWNFVVPAGLIQKQALKIQGRPIVATWQSLWCVHKVQGKLRGCVLACTTDHRWNQWPWLPH